MSGLAAGAAVSSTTKLALLAPPWGGGGGAGAVGCVALPRGVCRRGGWVRGGLWGALCRLWAGGGADVAAASAFLATVTMSAVAAGVAPFSVTRLVSCRSRPPWRSRCRECLDSCLFCVFCWTVLVIAEYSRCCCCGSLHSFVTCQCALVFFFWPRLVLLSHVNVGSLLFSSGRAS